MTPSDHPVSKILIVGPSWVGDLVMSQALYRTLKKNNPNTLIDVLAPTWCLDLVKRMPEVNQGIVLPIAHGKLDLKTRYTLGKTLRGYHYDQAIVLPNSWKSALIPWFAKIPIRTGFRGEFRYGILNDIRLLDPIELPMMAERFVALGYPKDAPFESKNGFLYPKLLSSRESIQKTLQSCQLPLPTQPILGLAPGAAFGEAKRWPAEYFGEVARTLQAQGWKVWLFGSRDDEPILQNIHRMTGGEAICFGYAVSLDQKIDLLSLCTALVSNDSGLLHIGAALNIPTIGIYGSTDSRFAPPLGDTVKILEVNSLACRPCKLRQCPLKGDFHMACLRHITPQHVLNWISQTCVS